MRAVYGNSCPKAVVMMILYASKPQGGGNPLQGATRPAPGRSGGMVARCPPWHGHPTGGSDIRTGRAPPDSAGHMMELSVSSPAAKYLASGRAFSIRHCIPMGSSCRVYGGGHVRTTPPAGSGYSRDELRLVGRGVAGRECSPTVLLAEILRKDLERLGFGLAGRHHVRHVPAWGA